MVSGVDVNMYSQQTGVLFECGVQPWVTVAAGRVLYDACPRASATGLPAASAFASGMYSTKLRMRK